MFTGPAARAIDRPFDNSTSQQAGNDADTANARHRQRMKFLRPRQVMVRHHLAIAVRQTNGQAGNKSSDKKRYKQKSHAAECNYLDSVNQFLI